MAKYVIDIPDEVKWIQYIQQTGHGTQNLKVESVYNLTPYTEPDEQSVKNNNIHLCWSCQNSSECPAKVKDILFGDDVGNDNICCCNAYRPTESNASDEDEIRQKAREEVWDFVFKFEGESEKINECFGMDSLLDVMSSMTYSEAKAKYEEWKKSKEEIRIGDELINHIGETYVIYDIDDHTAYGINFDKYPCTQECFPIKDGYSPKRTGRHFPEVAELLKKIREE